MSISKEEAVKSETGAPKGAVAKIVSLIKDGVSSGKYQPNDMLPSENAFVRQLGVSRWSVREGLSRLEANGLVRKIPGKGTFISGASSTNSSMCRVGLLIDSFLPIEENYYFLQLLTHVRTGLTMRGASFRLLNEIVDFTRSDHSGLLDDFTNDKLDALIVLPSSLAGLDHLEHLSPRGKQVIVFGSELNNTGLSQVWIDTKSGSQNAVEYLQQLGHQRIKVISPYEDNPIHANSRNNLYVCQKHVISRHAGYKAAMQKAGLAVDHDSIINVDLDLGKTIQAVEELFKRPDAPTALLITDGRIAPNVLHALASKQIRIPEDVSVISIDDTAVAQTNSPPITVVRQPLDVAADRIVQMIISGKPACKAVVSGELVVRKSCSVNK